MNRTKCLLSFTVCRVFTTILFVTVDHSALAFPVTLWTAEMTKRSSRNSAHVAFAKPPPISNFDLEAIEAFEAEIDLESSLSHPEEGVGSNLEDNDGSSDGSVQIYIVPTDQNNKRIDAVIASLEPSLSRSVCGRLVLDGKIRDGDGAILNKKSIKVPAGTVLHVELPQDEAPLEIIPEDIPLNILYEDEHMIVLNKAAGMVVHPAAGNWDGTVVNALAHHLATSPYGSGDFVGEKKSLLTGNGDLNDDIMDVDGESVSFRPGIVHRLDKGTTGVFVVAKTTQALGTLSESFAARRVNKTYLAITVGNPGKRVKIDKPIGRHPIHRQKMRVVPDPHRKDSSGRAPKDKLSANMLKKGRNALSYVDTLAFDSKLSLVQVRIETGRTHQIRVHLQDRHTPIYGDDIYGIADWNKRLYKSHGIQRPLLHAYRLEVDHPVSGERMVFVAPMSEDMKTIAGTIWPTGKEEMPEIFQ